MEFRSPTDNTYERGRGLGRREITKAQRREEEMSALHQMVPMFFLIQFVVVLVALVVAMLLADSQFSLPARKSSHRVTSHVIDGSRD
jgi:hypothetical protein